MGKIKSDKKTRIHLKPLGQGQASQLTDSTPSSTPNLDTASKDIIREASSNHDTTTATPDLNNNPFSGVKISSDFLKVKLDALISPDTLATEAEKDNEELHMPRKKDRMKNRREKFLKKLEVAYKSRQPAKKPAKKTHQNKKAVVGDLSFMKLALPEISTEEETNKTKQPAKMSKRQKRRLKRLNDANPLQTQKFEKLSNRPTSKQKHRHIVNEIAKFKESIKAQSTLKKGCREAILQNLQQRNLT